MRTLSDALYTFKPQRSPPLSPGEGPFARSCGPLARGLEALCLARLYAPRGAKGATLE